jgi:hypothetical protein
MLLCAPAAQAIITPVATIDGPSAEIVELGGVAMAPDGTGGIVYRKRVEGRPHIFAAVYSGGKWGVPQRVDVGQPYESTFPAIAAGEGGRLIVVWVNHYSSTTDGLFSAAMSPGSTGFQKPVAIDLNIGNATGAYPSVAMNGAGQALVAYRVIDEVSGPSTPNIPAGYVLDEIRMARSNGEYWSEFGQPLNRDLAQPVLAPTATNSPKVAIDLTGQGILIWQEPDDSFVNRVYARRIFGLTMGNILQVSPSSYEGDPLNGSVEDLAVDTAGFGEGAVAWLQQPSPGSGFTKPRVFVNEIPSSFDPKGSEFKGARIVDGAGAEGPTGLIGPLSMTVDPQGGFNVGYSIGDESFAAQGSEASVGTPLRLDEGGSGVPGNPGITRAADGALAAAWKLEEHGSGAVAMYERRSDGTPAHALVSSPAGGAIDALGLAGSHEGDALAGFMQGSGTHTEIAAAEVNAPPGSFVMNVPDGWVTGKRIPLQWEQPVGGSPPLKYGVLVEDEEVAEGIAKTEYTLKPAQIGNGVHKIRIEATDSLGQVEESTSATLKVDRTPPSVRLHVHGRTVTVKVSDHVSGVRKPSVHVSFGDGQSASGETAAKHTYTRAGTYILSVKASNKAGLKARLHKRVQV